ncbi:MAG TPA: FHA domain-containing protein [Kofleriaceae bacterium]
MDAWAHYRHLLTLGRDEFLAAAAPAVLVRQGVVVPDAGAASSTTQTLDHELIDERSESGGRGPAGSAGGEGARPLSIDDLERVDEARLHGRVSAERTEMAIYPLAKKPGASFPDRITIGRTSNNDVVIADHSVSRLHAYVRQGDGWIVADAGSKNGSWLDETRLEARRETPLSPGAVLRLGDVSATFYPAAQLFDLLGGDHGRR